MAQLRHLRLQLQLLRFSLIQNCSFHGYHESPSRKIPSHRLILVQFSFGYRVFGSVHFLNHRSYAFIIRCRTYWNLIFLQESFFSSWENNPNFDFLTLQEWFYLGHKQLYLDNTLQPSFHWSFNCYCSVMIEHLLIYLHLQNQQSSLEGLRIVINYLTLNPSQYLN